MLTERWHNWLEVFLAVARKRTVFVAHRVVELECHCTVGGYIHGLTKTLGDSSVVPDAVALEVAEADEVPYVIPGVLMDRNPHALVGVEDGGKVIDGERLGGVGGDVEVLASTHGVVEGIGG